MEMKLTDPRKNGGRNRVLPADLSACLGRRALLNLCLDAVQLVPRADLERARKHQTEPRPETLITLLTYCYSVGIYDSRDIEWSIRADATVRYICAGVRPDWHTLRRFRRANRDSLRDSLVHVMKQTWAFHFETGEADYAGYDWFESELVTEFKAMAVTRLDLAALLDGSDAD